MKTPTQATPENRSNTDNTTQADSIKTTTGLNSVRFDHSKTGDLCLANSTALGNSLNLGAMAKTAKYNRVTGSTITATDEKGLNILDVQLRNGIESIFDGIEVVAKLLAFNCDDVSEGDISKIGWLITGLAELGRNMNFHSSEVESELRNIKP